MPYKIESLPKWAQKRIKFLQESPTYSLNEFFDSVLEEIDDTNEPPKERDFYARISNRDNFRFKRCSNELGVNRSKIAKVLLHEFLKWYETVFKKEK